MYAYAGNSTCQKFRRCKAKQKVCRYAAWIKEWQVVSHRIRTRSQSQPQQEFRTGKAGW